MKRKYLVIAGYVISSNDGDTHWIPAGELMQLYGVDPSDCVIGSTRDINLKCYADYTVLLPRQSGNYKLPE